jgi:hypothetical protein
MANRKRERGMVRRARGAEKKETKQFSVGMRVSEHMSARAHWQGQPAITRPHRLAALFGASRDFLGRRRRARPCRTRDSSHAPPAWKKWPRVSHSVCRRRRATKSATSSNLADRDLRLRMQLRVLGLGRGLMFCREL